MNKKSLQTLSYRYKYGIGFDGKNWWSKLKKIELTPTQVTPPFHSIYKHRYGFQFQGHHWWLRILKSNPKTAKLWRFSWIYFFNFLLLEIVMGSFLQPMVIGCSLAMFILLLDITPAGRMLFSLKLPRPKSGERTKLSGKLILPADHKFETRFFLSIKHRRGSFFFFRLCAAITAITLGGFIASLLPFHLWSNKVALWTQVIVGLVMVAVLRWLIIIIFWGCAGIAKGIDEIQASNLMQRHWSTLAMAGSALIACLILDTNWPADLWASNFLMLSKASQEIIRIVFFFPIALMLTLVSGWLMKEIFQTGQAAVQMAKDAKSLVVHPKSY